MGHMEKKRIKTPTETLVRLGTQTENQCIGFQILLFLLNTDGIV